VVMRLDPWMRGIGRRVCSWLNNGTVASAVGRKVPPDALLGKQLYCIPSATAIGQQSFSGSDSPSD
jgi:hypothetical protein